MLVSRVRVRRRSSSRSTAGGWSSSPRWRSRVAVQALVGLSVLAVVSTGCQSNPKPPPLESASSSSATPTPSPTEAAPTLPAEAKGTSEAAAKAFVRHWIDVLNYAGPAADSDAVRHVSHPDCAACTAIADFIYETAAAGGAIRGEGWSVRRLDVISLTRTAAVVDVATTVGEQRVQTSADSAVETFPGGKRMKTFWLVRENDRWSVARLDQPE